MTKHLAALVFLASSAISFADAIEGKPMKDGYEISVITNKYPGINEMSDAGLTKIQEVTYLVALVDLNNDGRPEILAQIEHPDVCGSAGCMFVVLQKSASGYVELLEVTAGFPVEVSRNLENGYKTLSWGTQKKWVFHNDKYQ